MVIVEKKIAGLSATSLGRFVLRARKAAHLRSPVNVLVTSNAVMRSLNLRFRKIRRATDVLSFPSESASVGTRSLAGEIAISADIAFRNAAHLGHPAAIEAKVLALHGILHLAGFDHERDNGEMARKEAALRRKLGLPLSLTERSVSNSGPRARPQRVSRPTSRRRMT